MDSIWVMLAALGYLEVGTLRQDGLRMENERKMWWWMKKKSGGIMMGGDERGGFAGKVGEWEMS